MPLNKGLENKSIKIEIDLKCFNKKQLFTLKRLLKI